MCFSKRIGAHRDGRTGGYYQGKHCKPSVYRTLCYAKQERRILKEQTTKVMQTFCLDIDTSNFKLTVAT